MRILKIESKNHPETFKIISSKDHLEDTDPKHKVQDFQNRIIFKGRSQNFGIDIEKI